MQEKSYLILLFFLFSLVFLGCSANPVQTREVEITFFEKHPWEEAMHESMWYTLVWINGEGELVQRHIPRGVRKVTLSVPRDQTIPLCAYPLDTFYPFGGAVTPTGKDKVVLSQKQGVLSSLLLDNYFFGPEAVQRVNYPYLQQQVENHLCDISCLDAARLSKDLLNGELSSVSLKFNTPLQVTVSDIPAGYWIGEREQDPSFWSYWGHEGVQLELGDGTHCFWNKESSLLLKVFVDLKGKTFFTSLQNGPLW